MASGQIIEVLQACGLVYQLRSLTRATCAADVDEEIQELRDQLEDEVEYSAEMYERAQLAEAELTTLRASMATSKVAHLQFPL